MPADSQTFMFRSDLFLIDPQEDEQTNPFCYGRSLAEWISEKFTELGYRPEPVIAEDWGWCVMLQREPFMLWIACGNERSAFYDMITPEAKAAFEPDGREVVWTSFVGTETPMWTAYFWKRLVGAASVQPLASVVEEQLRTVLLSEARIQLLDQA